MLSFVRDPADVLVQVEIQRAADVQYEVTDRVFALVRPPPDLLVVERLDALADLGGKDAGNAGAERFQDGGGNLVSHDCVEYRLFICNAPELSNRGRFHDRTTLRP